MIRFGGVKDYDVKVAAPEFVRIGLNQKRFADYVISADQSFKEVIRQVKQIIEQD